MTVLLVSAWESRIRQRGETIFLLHSAQEQLVDRKVLLRKGAWGRELFASIY